MKHLNYLLSALCGMTLLSGHLLMTAISPQLPVQQSLTTNAQSGLMGTSNCVTFTNAPTSSTNSYQLDDCENGACNEYINCMVNKVGNEETILSDTSYASGLTNAIKQVTTATNNLNNYIGACFETSSTTTTTSTKGATPQSTETVAYNSCGNGVGLLAQAQALAPWAPNYFPSGTATLSAAIKSGIAAINGNNQALAITQILLNATGGQGIVDIANASAKGEQTFPTFNPSQANQIYGEGNAISQVVFAIGKQIGNGQNTASTLSAYIKNNWLNDKKYTTTLGKITPAVINQIGTAIANPKSISLNAQIGVYGQEFSPTYPNANVPFTPGNCDVQVSTCQAIANAALAAVNNNQPNPSNFSPTATPSLLPQTMQQLDDELQKYACCALLAQKEAYNQAACVTNNWQTVVNQIKAGAGSTQYTPQATLPTNLDPITQQPVDFSQSSSYALIPVDPDPETGVGSIYFPVLKDWVSCNNYTAGSNEQVQCLSGSAGYPPTGIGPTIFNLQSSLAPAKVALEKYVFFLQALKQNQGPSFNQNQCLNLSNPAGVLNLVSQLSVFVFLTDIILRSTGLDKAIAGGIKRIGSVAMRSIRNAVTRRTAARTEGDAKTGASQTIEEGANAVKTAGAETSATRAIKPTAGCV